MDQYYKTTYSLYKEVAPRQWELVGRFDGFEEAMRHSMQEKGRWRIDLNEPKALYSTP
jgi:hypothetical protein